MEKPRPRRLKWPAFLRSYSWLVPLLLRYFPVLIRPNLSLAQVIGAHVAVRSDEPASR